MRRDPREAFTHERRVDELPGVEHHVRAMDRRAAPWRLVVLQAHPALDDERLEALARARSRLRLDPEQADAADRRDGDGVAARHTRDEHRVAAKHCNGREHPGDQFLHTHLQLAGVFVPVPAGGAIAAPQGIASSCGAPYQDSFTT